MPEMILSQRLVQTLHLTPQLLLNLKLLQLPSLELEQLVRQELETNPLLEEIEEPPVTENTPSELEDLAPEAPPEAEVETVPQLAEELGPATEKTEPELTKLEGALDAGDQALADFMQDTSYLPPSCFDEAPEPDGDGYEPAGSGPARIGDVILAQIRGRFHPDDVPVAELIVDNLNDDGYLIVSTAELAQKLSLPEKTVEDVLFMVQHLEGGGLGARDLREALLRQLEVLGFEPDSDEYRIVARAADLMLRRQYREIARLLDLSEERIAAAMVHICQLDPKPGVRLTGGNPGYIAPDFCVEWDGNRLRYYATDDWVPRLRLSSKYREMLAHPRGVPRDQLEFAREKYQKALMLLKGIESRRRTLGRVLDHITKQQTDYFSQGREFLKPMSIKDTGAALGISPSTISRAVQGKYVETPFAILPMRFFFTSGTDGVARHSVKDKIKRIITEEDKKKPHSDQAIMKLLAEQGIKLSRRAVAKYRNEMNIAGCTERREQ